MATYEKQLGTLAAREDSTRIKVVQVAEPDETPTVEFRYQRHGESLGWVTHRRIRMAAGQVGALKDALNLMDPDGRDAERIDETSKIESLFDVIPGEGNQRSSG